MREVLCRIFNTSSRTFREDPLRRFLGVFLEFTQALSASSQDLPVPYQALLASSQALQAFSEAL